MNDGLKMIEYFTVMKKVTGFFEKKKSYRVYIGSIDNQGRNATAFNTSVSSKTHEYNFEVFQKFFPEMCSWPMENIKGNPTPQHIPGYRYYEVNYTLIYFVFETSQRAKKFIAKWGWMKEFKDLINFGRIGVNSENPLTVWRDPHGYTGKQPDVEKYFPIKFTEEGRLIIPEHNIISALKNLTFPHWYGELYNPDEGQRKSLRFRNENEKLIFKMGYLPT